MKKLWPVMCLFLLAATQKPRNSEEAEIVYRRSIMSQVDAHMLALTAVTAGKLENRRSALKQHAESMILLLKQSESLFPGERKKGKTRAKAGVWREKEQFLKMMKATEEELQNFVKDTPKDSMSSLEKKVDSIRKSCLKCHKNYKLQSRSLEAL